jgi:hypothetical protein
MFAVIRDGHPYIIDFPLYYAAGKLAHIAMQSPTNIYDIQLQDKILREIIFPVAPDPPWFIQYPPPVFLLATILPYFSLPAAWALWCIFGDAFFFFSLYMLLRRDLKSTKDFLYIVLAVCGSFPFWLCDRMGQIALITVPSAITFWCLLRSKRFLYAGFSTALIVLKFQYLPFLGLVGLAEGRLRFLAGALLSCATVAGLCGLSMGWQNVLTYPQTVMHAEYATNLYTGVNAREQQNIRALIVRTTGSDSPATNKICIGLCLLAALVLFAIWLQKRAGRGSNGMSSDDAGRSEKNADQASGNVDDTHSNKRFKFLASTTICCMLVFSPHAHTQDYLVLTVPAAWIWLESLKKNKAAKTWPRIFVIILPFLTWPLFIIDKFSPVPPFALLAPALVAAGWATFRPMAGKNESTLAAKES